MPIYGAPSLQTVVLHVATLIPASCTRYSVGATPTFKMEALHFTITFILKHFALLLE